MPSKNGRGPNKRSPRTSTAKGGRKQGTCK